MKIKNNKKASLVLISLLLVGFLLVLSTGILKVILSDSKDTYSMKNSLKAFYGAESGLELGLLRLKLKGFGYEYELKSGDKREELVLASGSTINKNRDVLLNYKIESKSNSSSGTINSGDSVIYPLFYKTGGLNSNDFDSKPKIIDTKEFKLDLIPGSNSASLITWGLIGKPKSGIKIKGLNGTGSGRIIDKDSKGITKIKEFISSSNKYKFTLTGSTINNFMSNHTGSYLQIGNLNNGKIKYKLEGSGNPNKFYTGKETIITSSARIGKNKQNIKLKIDNSKYLNIFRFTLYSK